MKLSHISIAILLVSVLVAPNVQAQTPAADNQSAVSSAGAAAPGAVQSASATAEVPRLIKFGGTLLDAQERPLAGPVGVTFALYARQTGGAALWLETQNVKPDANGNYTVLLGAASANGVPTELFTSTEARWLGIQVGQEPEQARILLVSVPYALKAKDAETLGGLPASAFVTNETVVSGSSSAGGVAAALTSSTSTPTASPTTSAQTTSQKAAGTPQPVVSCNTPLATVVTDGTASVNSIAKFTTPCKVENSAISESGGKVGLGIAPSASTKLFLVDSQKNFVNGWLQRGVFSSSATATGTNQGIGLDLDATNMSISPGVTDSGSRIGMRGLAFASSAGFAGTLNQQFGLVAQAGIFSAASTAKVTNAFGGQFAIFNRVPGTTITNAYGVFISNSDTTGTITNRYDLYASSPNANNFFAGKVGIGTTTPAAKLDVEGTGGVVGHDTNTAGLAAGVTGVSDSTVADSAGVLGKSTATTGTTIGMLGIANSPGGFGVVGENSASTGGVGVEGVSNAPGGFGVSGFNTASTGGVGVSGSSNATSGSSFGVSGINTSTGGIGVAGFAAATTGNTFGTRGTANSPNGIGVQGVNEASTGGVGVDGFAFATTGSSIGTRGTVNSPNGIGVEGVAAATTGNTIGTRGIVSSTGGIGVAGFASATTGSTIGTRGTVDSPSGTGVVGFNESSTGGIGVDGFASATTGSSIGTRGTVNSPGGTAALLNNTASGNIVIGQAAGVNKFRVDGNGSVITLGNAYLAAPGNGVILKSPNGTICKMISIDNTGAVTLTTVTCPAGP